ncbi:hypothetical protein L3Q82_010563 [Xyrichtys novacula]|uniref:Uncharacterized protein n=1 Tax=Xyrichtys novacula TaxID=13765 RepID=A0AAV1H3D1_XYRNO|nr:hypothetical protein L3Q82_010563 [Xyrichtys novacula]
MNAGQRRRSRPSVHTHTVRVTGAKRPACGGHRVGELNGLMMTGRREEIKSEEGRDESRGEGGGHLHMSESANQLQPVKFRELVSYGAAWTREPPQMSPEIREIERMVCDWEQEEEEEEKEGGRVDGYFGSRSREQERDEREEKLSVS